MVQCTVSSLCTDGLRTPPPPQVQILPFFLLLIPTLYYVVQDGGGGRETHFCLEWPLLPSVHLYCSQSRFSFLWKLFQSILQNSDCFIIIHYPYIVLSVIFSLKTYGPKSHTNYLIPGTIFYNFPLCSPIISPHTVPCISNVQWNSFY